MSLPTRQLATLGLSITLLHAATFFGAAWLLQTHGASMKVMVSKMDQIEYMELADTMLIAHRFALSSDAPAEIFRTPGYPSLIALVDALSGGWYWALFIVHSLLVGLTAMLVSLIAAGIGMDSRRSLAAGALFGISSGPLLLTMSGSGSDIVYTALVTLATYWVLREHTNPLRRAVLTGITLGVATLVRPIGILASLPFLLGIGLIRYSNWQGYIRTALLTCASFSIILLPWYVRNAAQTGIPFLSSVSTFNLMYYNIPMNEAFWTDSSEKSIRADMLEKMGAPDADALRDASYLSKMRSVSRSYLEHNTVRYAVFHLYHTAPFFFASGFNVMNALLSHEAPSLRIPLFPTEQENLTRFISAHEWGSALRALGHYWFTTLERLSWLLAILAAFAAPFLASGRTKRILLLFVAIIVMNMLLVSPVTQARYRVPAEPFIWIGAVFTAHAMWRRWQTQTGSGMLNRS